MEFIFHRVVKDEFKFNNKEQVMAFSGRKTVLCRIIDWVFTPVAVEFIDVQEMFRGISQSESYSSVKDSMIKSAHKYFDKNGIDKDSNAYKVVDNILKSSIVDRNAANILIGGLNAEEVINRISSLVEDERRILASEHEFNYVVFRNMDFKLEDVIETHYRSVDYNSVEFSGYYENNFDENPTIMKMNLTACNLPLNNHFNIMTLGECIAKYISYKYLGKEDEAENPFDPFAGSVIRDENVISDRSGTKLTKYLRDCGFAFAGFRFDNAFEDLKKVLAHKDEVEKINDDLLRDKVKYYLTADFNIMRNLQNRYKRTCREDILSRAKENVNNALSKVSN